MPEKCTATTAAAPGHEVDRETIAVITDKASQPLGKAIGNRRKSLSIEIMQGKGRRYH